MDLESITLPTCPVTSGFLLIHDGVNVAFLYLNLISCLGISHCTVAVTLGSVYSESLMFFPWRFEVTTSSLWHQRDTLIQITVGLPDWPTS